MFQIDLVIFDLDGTLIDSKGDLVQAVNAARAHMRMGPLDEGRVASYVGSGAPVLIRRVLGPEASEEQIQEALEYFIEYYRDHCLDYTQLYPGVQESLDRLNNAGLQLAVLTNKPVKISNTILGGLGVARLFRYVYGGNSFDHKKPHPIGVQTLMADCRATRERTLMVGDSTVDVQTARNAGVKACGVTYGFQPETLADPRPDLLVNRMEEMAAWVLQPNGRGPITQ
jgi:phosphoglycolate phosphatase